MNDDAPRDPRPEVDRIMIDKYGRPFTVRPYRASDREALVAMYTDFEPKRASQGLPSENEAARRRWLETVLGVGLHLVAVADGHLLGHAMLIPMDDEDGAELATFLHQSIRNRGIGTELNRVALALARQHGFRRVWLSVEPSNRAALRSYGKVGFQQLPGSLWAPEVEMEAVLGHEPAEARGVQRRSSGP